MDVVRVGNQIISNNSAAQVLSLGVELFHTKRAFQKPLMYSDRGSQYSRDKHQQILNAFGMSCKGNCWDNAVSKSFFASFVTRIHESF
jgi:transposase InsO family protein